MRHFSASRVLDEMSWHQKKDVTFDMIEPDEQRIARTCTWSTSAVIGMLRHMVVKNAAQIEECTGKRQYAPDVSMHAEGGDAPEIGAYVASECKTGTITHQQPANDGG